MRRFVSLVLWIHCISCVALVCYKGFGDIVHSWRIIIAFIVFGVCAVAIESVRGWGLVLCCFIGTSLVVESIIMVSHLLGSMQWTTVQGMIIRLAGALLYLALWSIIVAYCSRPSTHAQFRQSRELAGGA